VHPQAEQESNFEDILLIGGDLFGGVGVVNLAVVAYVFEATTKKVVNMFEEKSAPSEKIVATPIVESK